MGLIALVGVVIWGFAPGVVHAAKTHTFTCSDCHAAPSTANPRAMGNLCVNCHKKTEVNTLAKFDVGTASNARGNNPSPGSGSGAETSHFWGGNSTVQLAAGSASPTPTFYTSRAGISTNRITCTICHDPHGVDGTKLVRASIVGDLICQQCHQQWFVNNASAALTHPIVADYAARAAAANAAALAAGEPQDRYKVAPDNSLAGGVNGDIRLMNNGTTDGVTCTSCHGVHFTDSDSASADTRENYNAAGAAFSKGDGKLLRSDGATRTNKSALCQACHNYRPHGDSGTKHSITGTAGVTATTTVGCLECHSGHSYNNGNVQFYVLRSQIGAPYNATFTAPYDYAVKPASHDQVSPWQDGAGSNGYCEKCHGDTTLLSGSQHSNTAKCLTCHFHNSSPAGYSFEPGANVAICGDCHGFPPHLDARGDRSTLPANEGGYAYIAAANNYSLASNYKNESTTPHNAHAAAGVLYNAQHPTKAGLPTGSDSDYRMGDGELACSSCHGVRPSHNTGTTAVMGSYENLEFDSRAAVDGQTAPAYAGAGRETCNNVYCHSNGGRRAGNNPTEATRVWSFIETPYTGGGTASGWKNGKGTLITALPALGNATECATCHGNTSATMTSRGNSAAHNKHLAAGYTCNVCHVNTATDNISVPKVARDISKNAGDPTKGTHVNQKVDVNFDPAITPAIGSGTYTAATGTCALYCHSDGKGNFSSADWDVAASGACNTCHLTTTLASGSHSRHISATTGPLLSCDKCHGSNAALGTHPGHVDGAVTVTASICTTCHAVDGAETVPVWGSSATSDCKTCHTGASTTAAGQIGATAAPAKAVALSVGHGKNSGTYAVTGKNAANRDCAACHTSTVAGHFDGISGDDQLLTGGFACTSCHNGTTAVQVRTHDNTDPTYTNQKRGDFSLQCEACHDPHGSSNIAMVAPTKSGYNGTAVFSAFTGTNSFDESDSGAGANNDDLCATCHTTPLHNNRAVASTHHEGEQCTSCHGHNGTLGGFMPTGGNACNDCHGNPPATGAHARHTAVTIHDQTEDRTDCDKCHTGASTYTYSVSGNHQNSAVDLAAGSAGGTTGCTSACHVSTASDGFWTDATGLNCDACHYYAAVPTSAGNTAAGTRALSAQSHNKHFDKNKTCSACHTVENGGAAMAGPLTHITNTTGANEGFKFTGMGQSLQDEAAVARASMTFDDNLNTCSGGIGLGCHATGTPDWDIAIPATGCTQCHADTTDATVNPTSGLHNVSVATRHDATLAAGNCVNCHTTAPSNLHMNGTLNNSSAATYAFGASVTYTAAAGCQTACHADGGDWKRRWNGAIDAKPLATDNPGAAVCQNCHGDFTGWRWNEANGTTTDHTDPYAGNVGDQMNQHGGCQTCHGWGAAGYDKTWATGKHGDGFITMNGPAPATGAGYDNATGGCAAACHSAAFVMNTNSAWTANFGDYGSGSCSGCHGGDYAGASNLNYWPGAAGATAPDRAGEHNAHMIKLVAKLGYNMAALTDAEQKTMCGYCHIYGVSVGEGGHNDVAPSEVGAFDRIMDGLADTGTAGSFSGGNGVGGSCANVDCHNNKTTPATSEWNDGSTSACIMCHNDVTLAGDTSHTAHLGAAALFGKTITCSNCHNAATNWGTNTPPAANHINGTFTATSYTGFTYPGVKGSCGVNSCHNNGKNAAAPAYTWGTPLSNCVTCHGDTSTLSTQSHTAHLINTTKPLACSVCHAAATAATHMNGTINLPVSASFTYGGDVLTTGSTVGSCGTTNICHNNGKNAAGSAYTWGTAIGAVNSCTECHAALPATQSHTAHLQAATQTTFGITIACSDCHTLASATHMNGTINLAGAKIATYSGDVLTTGTTYGNCGTNICHNNGANAATPAYTWGTALTNCTTECHITGVTLATNAHNEHFSATTDNCTDCHTAPTLSTHMNGSVNIDAVDATYSIGNAVATSATPNGTCATISCHNRSGAQSIAWNVATGNVAGTTDLACDSCHYWNASPTKAGNTAHFAPLTATHGDHFNAGKTCTQCHGTLPTLTTHITTKTVASDMANALQDEAAMLWTHASAVTDYTLAADNTCGTATNNGLGCHATGTPDWDIAFDGTTACTNCHTNTTSALVNPTSGLHNGTMTVSANTHDDNFQITKSGASTGTCVTCHTGSPSSAHLNGTFNNSPAAVAAIITFATNMGFTDSATAPTCGPTLTLSTCHTDDGVWKRKWSVSAKDAGNTRCANCHGDFTAGFTTGVGARHQTTTSGDAGGEVGANHNGTDKCYTCHAYKAGDTTLYNFATQHNDGSIQVANTSFVDNGTTGGCTGCHLANDGIADGQHSFTEVSGIAPKFSRTLITGPAVTCSGCHATITTHVDADGAGAAYTAGNCTDCHSAHSGYRSGVNAANDVYISTISSRVVVGGGPDTGSAIPTMNQQYATHDSYIQLGGAATAGYTKTTEAEICWACHDAYTNARTRTAATITFTTNTIVDSGNGFAIFAVGRNVTISGSSVAANNKTVPITGVAAGTLTFAAATFTADATAGETVTITDELSEWGPNLNADTGSGTYGFGQLFTDVGTVPGTRTSNWTTGFWRSDKGLNSTLSTSPYWYKRGAIRSTHSANYDGTTVAAGSDGTNWKAGLINTGSAYSTTYNKGETLDAAANLRCSYCHDVHGTHNSVNGDNSTGAPYLRGTWLSNPYAEDGAPRFGMANWSTQGGGATIANGTPDFGIVPRGSADPNQTGITVVSKVGGWWIDQNSGNPVAGHANTAFRTATGNAGLCDQCHGSTKDGTWTATEIQSIDQITGEGLWVSTFNGHANSVVGGTMAETGVNLQWNNTTKVGRNIFNRTVRGDATMSAAQSNKQNVDMGLVSQNGSGRGYSYRSSSGSGTGYGWIPRVNNTISGTTGGEYSAFAYFAWNNVDYGTTARNSVHAAGTLKLNPSNVPAVATETAHNAQVNYHTFSCSKCHNPHASRLPKLMITDCLDTNHNTWEDNTAFTGTAALTGVWAGARHSQYAAAQTCHRLDARAPINNTVTLGSGWNKVTPWIEDTTPNSTKAADLTTLPAY